MNAPASEYANLSLAMAGWIRYLCGKDEAGQAIVYEDNMAEVLQPLAQDAYNSGNVKPFMQKAFGDKLASSDMYCALVGAHL